MHEIKFRAWLQDQKKMVFVHTMSWFRHDGGHMDISYIDYSEDPKQIEVFDNDNGNRFVVMQYTGLKDKNGYTEIYEGDIVRRGTGDSFEVVFHQGEFCVKIPSVAPTYSKLHAFEVIGNIHENPELLKQEPSV